MGTRQRIVYQLAFRILAPAHTLRSVGADSWREGEDSCQLHHLCNARPGESAMDAVRVAHKGSHDALPMLDRSTALIEILQEVRRVAWAAREKALIFFHLGTHVDGLI
eukprot:944901-Prymnesium_polylepis.3